MAGFLVVVAGAVIPGVGSSILAMFSEVASRLTKANTQAS